MHQKAPFTDHLLRRLRKAVPRHVDKTEQERIANVEEIQLLRTPRRVRGARQSIPSRKSVQERTFADIGAAGESDFLYIRVWQEFHVRCGFQEGFRTAAYLSPRLPPFNLLFFLPALSLLLLFFSPPLFFPLSPFLFPLFFFFF